MERDLKRRRKKERKRDGGESERKNDRIGRYRCAGMN